MALLTPLAMSRNRRGEALKCLPCETNTKGYGLSGISWGSKHMCAYTAQPHDAYVHMDIAGPERAGAQ